MHTSNSGLCYSSRICFKFFYKYVTFFSSTRFRGVERPSAATQHSKRFPKVLDLAQMWSEKLVDHIGNWTWAMARLACSQRCRKLSLIGGERGKGQAGLQKVQVCNLLGTFIIKFGFFCIAVECKVQRTWPTVFCLKEFTDKKTLIAKIIFKKASTNIFGGK